MYPTTLPVCLFKKSILSNATKKDRLLKKTNDVFIQSAMVLLDSPFAVVF